MAGTGTVCVSGASGFIASHVVLQLLNAGYHVRGSVRSDRRADDLRKTLDPHLAPGAAIRERLTFARLDLLSDEGWNEAVRGCDAVIHTASPFPAVVPADPEELVRPAVDGALRALRAAKDEGIGRVVLTSSVAAIWYSSLPPGQSLYTEESWSDPDSAGPYPRSKTLAERAAWEFVRDEAPGIALTVINPALVIGPPLGTEVSTSLRIVKRIFRGGGRPQQRGAVCIVDVRDVARMHVQALTTPESVGRRIICSERMISYRDIAELLSRAYPDRNISIAVEDAADVSGREAVDVDNSLGKSLFKLSYISADASVRATAAFLDDLE